jgi:hypothetical protein
MTGPENLEDRRACSEALVNQVQERCERLLRGANECRGRKNGERANEEIEIGIVETTVKCHAAMNARVNANGYMR